MPSYVNIGAYVGEGTMVDTWATVGSCAQIGSHVHLSGGVGIGGVLEPVQAAPVIIEDNCFVGCARDRGRGAHVCREAVLGSNTVITGSTHIIDVTGAEPVEYRGYVPPRSVVIREATPRSFRPESTAWPARSSSGGARSRPTRRPRSTTRCAISALRCKGGHPSAWPKNERINSQFRHDLSYCGDDFDQRPRA